MSGYIGSKASVVSSGAERKKTFAITTSTTSLTGLNYTPNQVHVFHNGVRLVDGTDYTATNGTSITLTSAAESGDQVVVVSYATFQVADAYTQAEADAEFVAKAGDTMTGNLSFGDNDKAIFGAGSDLQIYHDGSHSYISEQGTGNLWIYANDLVLSNGEGSQTFLYAQNGGPVYLSYANVAKLATTSTGIDVTGTVTADGLTVDGNVGIGTSSPSNTLSLEGSGTGLNINSTNDEVKKIAFENSGVLTGYIGSSTSSPLRFLNGSGTERMRINSSGNLLIKTTGPAIPVSALAAGSVEAVGASANNVFKAKVTTSAYIAYASQGPTSGAAPFYYHSYMLNGSNTAAGHITVNNTSTSYSTSSDYRLKTDAQPMTGASARVQALNPVNFEWIADGTRVDGFLAHEAQEVVPECATGTKDAMRDEEYEVTPAIEATYDDDGNELTSAVDAVMGTRSVPDYQGIDQSKLVPLLTAALQEALTEITDLKARVIALEGN